jgi:hypothetical protein
LGLTILMIGTDISSISESQFRLVCGIFKSKTMEMNGDCKAVLLSEIAEALDTANLCCASVRSLILNDEVVDDLSQLHTQMLAHEFELARLRITVKRLSPIQYFALLERIEEALDDHDGDFEGAIQACL